MNNVKGSVASGQGLVEYVLLIALVAIVVVAILLVLGAQVGGVFSQVIVSTSGASDPVAQPTAANALTLNVMDDFLRRISAFHDETGHWPRSWGEYKFTDLGLDPAEWAGAVAGIYWNPNGDKIGLANRAGDDIQVYVVDLNGNTRHLYDNWNIWCLASNSRCYYHSLAPENEVDINTISIVHE